MNYCDMNRGRLSLLYSEMSLEKGEEMVSSYWSVQLAIRMEESLSKTKNKPKNK